MKINYKVFPIIVFVFLSYRKFLSYLKNEEKRSIILVADVLGFNTAQRILQRHLFHQATKGKEHKKVARGSTQNQRLVSFSFIKWHK